jgi:hypothetical protein
VSEDDIVSECSPTDGYILRGCYAATRSVSLVSRRASARAVLSAEYTIIQTGRRWRNLPTLSFVNVRGTVPCHANRGAWRVGIRVRRAAKKRVFVKIRTRCNSSHPSRDLYAGPPRRPAAPLCLPRTRAAALKPHVALASHHDLPWWNHILVHTHFP